MTRRLILIRHAKSSWDDPFADDHARVLNERGRASAKAVGDWLAGHGFVPDLVLCSDAARTQETAQLILPQLTPAPQLQLSARLYHASPDTLFDMIRKQDVPTLALIGHNPGIGMLAEGLVRQAPDHQRFGDYPTCATVIMDFAGDDWSGIRRGTGQVIDFIVPRDLIGTSAQA